LWSLGSGRAARRLGLAGSSLQRHPAARRLGDPLQRLPVGDHEPSINHLYPTSPLEVLQRHRDRRPRRRDHVREVMLPRPALDPHPLRARRPVALPQLDRPSPQAPSRGPPLATTASTPPAPIATKPAISCGRTRSAATPTSSATRAFTASAPATRPCSAPTPRCSSTSPSPSSPRSASATPCAPPATPTSSIVRTSTFS
jgi:hypothetical protein